jgi:PTH1 family peptidyl-tRNA hydrolase
MRSRKLVVGLGNPGPRYAQTPHNLGFEVVRLLGSELGATWRLHEMESSRIAACSIERVELLLAMPQTYMNLSGQVVGLLCSQFSFTNLDLIVICDDLALPVGKIRIRAQGGAGGHNGLKSITETLGREDFCRVRLGIAPDFVIPGAAEYVLTPIPDRYRPDFELMTVQGKEAVKAICLEGLVAAMNHFN